MTELQNLQSNGETLGGRAGKIKTLREPVRISPAADRAFAVAMDEIGGARFRRGDIAKRIYPLTKPRNRALSETIADALIRKAAKRGKLQRDGHLHWLKVTATRTTLAGRKVAEASNSIDLVIKRRCPEKYALVDLETGDVWQGGRGGSWVRASAQGRVDAANAAGNGRRRKS